MGTNGDKSLPTQQFSMRALQIQDVVEVDPAIHNSNTFEFAGRRLRLGSNGSRASDQALEAVRCFVAEHGTSPTAASWTHAGMSPSEKTIRRRFGSFKTAVQCAREA
jgi:hypothetical protein